ncbi:uncharacterized protein LOC122039580 [Zingiber officinale]|uniref:uncharacterized protein LOC122039580 n=1 Tax=Zingiber officinale TaxID=94328 RepID=UPI001C4CA516|nr:uncharacterized protein LOC122039580 [Zingiber officinale]
MTNRAAPEQEEGAESSSTEERGESLRLLIQESEVDDESFDKGWIDRRKKKKERVKRFLSHPIRQLEELYIDNKNKRKERRLGRQPSVPFPYAYDDPATSIVCYSCLRPPPISDDFPPGEILEATTKPSLSSYRDFLKSMLEKNDFYSKECNVHRDVLPQRRNMSRDLSMANNLPETKYLSRYP